jgi:hypothetical protein
MMVQPGGLLDMAGFNAAKSALFARAAAAFLEAIQRPFPF